MQRRPRLRRLRKRRVAHPQHCSIHRRRPWQPSCPLALAIRPYLQRFAAQPRLHRLWRWSRSTPKPSCTRPSAQRPTNMPAQVVSKLLIYLCDWRLLPALLCAPYTPQQPPRYLSPEVPCGLEVQCLLLVSRGRAISTCAARTAESSPLSPCQTWHGSCAARTAESSPRPPVRAHPAFGRVPVRKSTKPSPLRQPGKDVGLRGLGGSPDCEPCCRVRNPSTRVKGCFSCNQLSNRGPCARGSPLVSGRARN